MKIYSIDSPLSGDNILFKEVFYLDSKASNSNDGIEKGKSGQVIKIKWGVDLFDKPVGDYISFPIYGLASKVETINSFKKFAPLNIINPLEIDGRSDVFSYLRPVNYQINDSNIEHVFLMFSKYKKLLITQLFKDEWESRGLTGAEFVFVTEMDDSRFI